MSVNSYLPHILVLPEDDANRELAVGFLLDASVRVRNIQVLPPAGGWLRLLELFKEEHIPDLRRFQNRNVLLLMDFDDSFDSRLKFVSESIPPDLKDRVYLLGVLSEPEPLRTACGVSLEDIGKSLAGECYRREANLWNHALLTHNAPERERLVRSVYGIIFS